MAHSYHEQVDIQNIQKLRELCASLPPFCQEFFRGIEPQTASRTRIAYAYDLIVFFHYLQETNPILAKIPVQEMRVELLDQLTVTDLEEFLQYIKYYNSTSGLDHMNHENSLKRKLATIKTFYNYFFKKETIRTNPAALVSMPKIREKNIVRLEPDDDAQLLDTVEDGSGLTKQQQAYHSKTGVRDLAIMTLLLGTGIRVSECVGLDLNDLNLKDGYILIYRKGGKEVTVYFGEEVEEALLPYLEQRKAMHPSEGHEKALFLSLQNRRISVRAVENLVKKYSETLPTTKKITPHKLRSTYGTSLYRETSDIYLVADVLGHSDVNTTRKHYAALEDEHRRSARNKVQLRDRRKNV